MEDKVIELEKRIESLEKIEHRRKIRSIIVLTFYGVIILTIIVSGIYLYYKLKPYKQKLDDLKNIAGELKVDNVIDGSDGSYSFDNFGGFDDFFNNFFNY